MENHVSFTVFFDVPEGKEFKSKFGDLYSSVKSGTPECLYFGFGTVGHRVLCREAYASAEGTIAHGEDVKDLLQDVVKTVGGDRIKMLLFAAPADMAVLEPNMKTIGARCITLESGALNPTPLPKDCPDTHLSILVEFKLSEGKMEDFKAGFPKFYEATKNGSGADGCLYYSFGTEGNSAFCREGYKDAAAFSRHQTDIQQVLSDQLKIFDVEMKVDVVGPKEELDALRPKLSGAEFWELDSGSLWR